MNEQESKKVTVTLSGSLSMKQEISLRKAVEIARFLAEDTHPLSPAPSNTTTTAFAPKTSSSALEIIKNSKAKTFPQQIAALAYHVTQRDKTEFFDPKDVQLLLRRMGNPPQNFGRDLQKATDILGYVSKEAPGQYIVTETAKELISNGFQDAVEGKSRRKK